MKNLTAIIFGMFFLALAGCGSSSNSADPPDPNQRGMLSVVTDVAAFEASIKAGLTSMSSDEQLAVAGTAADGKTQAPVTIRSRPFQPLRHRHIPLRLRQT